MELVRKNFHFLVEQYEFTYKQTNERSFSFTSKKVRIELQIGHKTPWIHIYRIGEPEFTGMILQGIIQYFERRPPKINFEFHPLEHNIKFMAKVLKDRAHKIIDEIDGWWIPVQLYQYRIMEMRYKKKDQLEDFLFSYKRDYDYLKSKGAI